MARITVIALVIGLLAPAMVAAAQQPGIAGRPAPPWGVREWINLPEGKQTLDAKDFEGKVVVVFAFQSWCPGCHSRGFPTLKKLIEEYEDADDVSFVAVQTVFEGFATNTADRAWETAREYALDIPVGHDGTDGRRSILMQLYRTGGTPWMIVIDKKGIVRFNDFHMPVHHARGLIDQLRGGPGAIEVLPWNRGGQDLVGRRFRKPEFDRFVGDAEPPANTKATLYRWWTDSCPYCRASLPAVETLRRKYGPKGLDVVGVYHPKPPRAVSDVDVRFAARQLGYNGRIAVDEGWTALEHAYLGTGGRGATSVTFLVDADGVIRFLHPGPVFFPSDRPNHAVQNDDYLKLEKAIATVLREQPKEEPHEKEHSR